MPSYTDTSVADGITYYYVVAAVNSSGTSSNSAQVSATPAKAGTGTGGSGVAINVDMLTNRHFISPYVYGGNGPKDAATITDSGSTLVRWGGNAASTYNWQLGTYNADADWYYEDFLLSPPLNNPADRDSGQFIKDVKAAGSTALTTMAMLDWVAQAQGWSFPVTTWASQCKFDPYNSDTTGWTPALIQALATRIYRDYWDPTYTTESGYKNNAYVTVIEPKPTIPFRIPRMRAIANAVYPGTPLAFTEWSAAFAGESDFSTALGDVDAYGVLGRERVALATRWGAPDPANPNYQALKLYTNYDGAHHSFNAISVLATHNADPNLLSVYAATTAAGKSMTVMVLNKDPSTAVTANLSFNGFTPAQVTSYTLSQGAPKTITAGATQPWPSTMVFPPYTATLLVITGSSASNPTAEWDLNPDTIRVPAGGQVTLHPKLVSGSANLTISTGTFDAGITPTITGSTVSGSQPGSVLISAGNTPGFYHFNVKASDGTTQGGWIVVGNPPAALAMTAGADQTAPAGTVLPVSLAVTLSPGQSGGSAAGASVFFTTSAGSLQNVQVGSEKVFTGSKVIAPGVWRSKAGLQAASGPESLLCRLRC